MALPGITNANAFDSAHDLESLLAGDFKKVRQCWCCEVELRQLNPTCRAAAIRSVSVAPDRLGKKARSWRVRLWLVGVIWIPSAFVRDGGGHLRATAFSLVLCSSENLRTTASD
jgi:hypothetical protein